jgi:hypothetical protein
MTAPVSDARLDYPEKWDKKSNLEGKALNRAFLAFMLIMGAIGFGYNFFAATPWPGVVLSAVLSVSFAVASVIAIIVGKKTIKKSYAYVDSFHEKVKTLAKSRHGLDLSTREVEKLLSFVSSLTGPPKIEVNSGDQRMSVVLRSLTTGKDIRFYHADTNEELATVPQSSVVAEIEPVRLDLPKGFFRYVVGRSQYWTEFFIGSVPILVICYGLIAIPRLVFTSDTIRTIPTASTLMLTDTISLVALAIWGVWLRYYHRSANAETVIAQTEFANIVRDRYKLTLSDVEVNFIYAGGTLTTEANGSHLTIQMSTLLGGKDVRLIEVQSEEELAILPT